MDSSNNIGATEECSSNESGWTMYIASPGHENSPDDDGDGDGDSHGSSSIKRKECKFVHGDEIGSDDSMASDASSGPSHQGTYKKSHDKGNKQSKQVGRKGGAQKPKAGKKGEEEHGGKVRSSRTSDVCSKGKSRKNK